MTGSIRTRSVMIGITTHHQRVWVTETALRHSHQSNCYSEVFQWMSPRYFPKACLVGPLCNNPSNIKCFLATHTTHGFLVPCPSLFVFLFWTIEVSRTSVLLRWRWLMLLHSQRGWMVSEQRTVVQWESTEHHTTDEFAWWNSVIL